MICFPNAKINLGLNVVNKRPDGYHNIETLFYPVPLRDALEIVGTDGKDDLFTQSGIPVSGDPADNLVMRALKLLRQKYAIPSFEIHLLKGIPFGAGLGGGSADAAFMLKLINDYCSLGLSSDELEQMAGHLGADCPFFIENRPVFATGTGNQFTPVELSLKGYYLCLVKPDIFVSTPEAYAQITPQPPARSLLEIAGLPVTAWWEMMVNDFEPSVFNRYPLIGQIKERLYEAGAVYASMSGSGSSVFGLFTGQPALKKHFPDCFVWEGLLDK